MTVEEAFSGLAYLVKSSNPFIQESGQRAADIYNAFADNELTADEFEEMIEDIRVLKPIGDDEEFVEELDKLNQVLTALLTITNRK